MYSSIDNLDYNISENLNTFNQEINDQYSIFNNTNYFSLNFNFLNYNDNKDFNPINNNYFITSLINKNINHSNDFNCSSKQEISKINNIIEDKKKIFVISHQKRKPEIKLVSKDEIKNKAKKISFIKPSFININKSYFTTKSNKIQNNDIKTILLEENNEKEKSIKEIKKESSHNKFSDDNLRRKCKHLVLNSTIELINKKIYLIYDGNIGNNIFRKEILTLGKYQISNANIEFDKIFIHKKISEILSENISTRYTNYSPEHNKILIENLRNENDSNKSIYFNKLFNLTFNDCMNHFIGKKYFEELEGMRCFESLKPSLDGDNEYFKVVKFYLENFENIITNKKSRNKKRNNKNNNDNRKIFDN